MTAPLRLYGAALRSLVLLAAGLLMAILAALFVARRMTGPIRELQQGAAEIGAGNLNRRLDIHTGDEIEAKPATIVGSQPRDGWNRFSPPPVSAGLHVGHKLLNAAMKRRSGLPKIYHYAKDKSQTGPRGKAPP